MGSIVVVSAFDIRVARAFADHFAMPNVQTLDEFVPSEKISIFEYPKVMEHAFQKYVGDLTAPPVTIITALAPPIWDRQLGSGLLPSGFTEKMCFLVQKQFQQISVSDKQNICYFTTRRDIAGHRAHITLVLCPGYLDEPSLDDEEVDEGAYADD